MAKLIWSRRALADLQGICEYIARDSDRYAKLFAERVIRSVDSIPEHYRKIAQAHIGFRIAGDGMGSVRNRGSRIAAG